MSDQKKMSENMTSDFFQYFSALQNMCPGRLPKTIFEKIILVYFSRKITFSHQNNYEIHDARHFLAQILGFIDFHDFCKSTEVVSEMTGS